MRINKLKHRVAKEFKYTVEFPESTLLEKIFTTKKVYFEKNLKIRCFTAAIKENQLFITIQHDNQPERIKQRIIRLLEHIELETKVDLLIENGKKTGVEIIFYSDIEDDNRNKIYEFFSQMWLDPSYCVVSKAFGKIQIKSSKRTPVWLRDNNLLEFH